MFRHIYILFPFSYGRKNYIDILDILRLIIKSIENNSARLSGRYEHPIKPHAHTYARIYGDA